MGNCMFLRKGEVHTAPVTGIAASTLAVGSTVKLMESGAAVEYLVVNQGKPGGSSLYDDSCDGTWILRKDCMAARAWDSGGSNQYADSDINTWLNGDFFDTLGTVGERAVKQAKIPYGIGGGDGTVNSGANGLSVRAFLLGAYEVGWRNMQEGYMPVDGATLSYFTTGDTTAARAKRIANYNGTAAPWWQRAPRTDNEKSLCYYASDTGKCFTGRASYTEVNVRPALVLSFNAKFDEITMILRG